MVSDVRPRSPNLSGFRRRGVQVDRWTGTKARCAPSLTLGSEGIVHRGAARAMDILRQRPVRHLRDKWQCQA